MLSKKLLNLNASIGGNLASSAGSAPHRFLPATLAMPLSTPSLAEAALLANGMDRLRLVVGIAACGRGSARLFVTMIPPREALGVRLEGC